MLLKDGFVVLFMGLGSVLKLSTKLPYVQLSNHFGHAAWIYKSYRMIVM